jgi:hypothetical protein
MQICFYELFLSILGKRYGSSIESSETSGLEPFERDSAVSIGLQRHSVRWKNN